MLDRKVSAKSASSVFYEAYNDVDIYIEDTAVGYRKIFKEILSKALHSQFAIEQVFPIGNRNEVIAECEKNQSHTGRKRVYIIDGDLFILNGNDRTDLKGLFVLPRYCIENFFFNQDGIVQTAYEEESEMEMDEIIAGLDFDNWLLGNEVLLLELFIVYAICYKQIPSEQTIGFKVNKLCSSSNGIVCPEKIERRINDLKEKLVLHFGEERMVVEINLIKEKIKEKDHKLLRYVSGKDYLLPLMLNRLKSFLKISNNNTSLRIRLAMRSDVEELKSIVEYIYE